MSWLAKLLPGHRRHWVEAMLAESDTASWRLGLLRFVVSTWMVTIGENPMKTVLLTLSAMNFALGGFLGWLFLTTGADALDLAAVAIAILVQGGFSLAYLLGWMSPVERAAERLILAGSAMALMIGGLGFVISTISNLSAPAGADLEFGPMVVGAMLAAHAAAAIYALAIERGEIAAV